MLTDTAALQMTIYNKMAKTLYIGMTGINRWWVWHAGSRASCTDPESNARGGPTLTTFFLVDEGRDDPNTTISGPTSARKQMPLKWRFTVVPLTAQH